MIAGKINFIIQIQDQKFGHILKNGRIFKTPPHPHENVKKWVKSKHIHTHA